MDYKGISLNDGSGNYPPVGPKPVHINCPLCRAQIATKIEYNSGNQTHLSALILCALLLWPCIALRINTLCFWPCICLPYYMKSFRNANHYCPNCAAFIGTYRN